jgi:hypothetical protein
MVRLLVIFALLLPGCAIPLGEDRGTLLVSMRVDYLPPHDFNPTLRGYRK